MKIPINTLLCPNRLKLIKKKRDRFRLVNDKISSSQDPLLRSWCLSDSHLSFSALVSQDSCCNSLTFIQTSLFHHGVGEIFPGIERQSCSFFKFLEDISLMCSAADTFFGHLVTSALGFEAKVDSSLVCNAPVVRHLPPSWWPAWQLNHLDPHNFRSMKVLVLILQTRAD